MIGEKNHGLDAIMDVFHRALSPIFGSGPIMVTDEYGSGVQITYEAADGWKARVYGFPCCGKAFVLDVRVFHAEICPTYSRMKDQNSPHVEYEDPLIAVNVWTHATRLVGEALPVPVQFTSKHLVSPAPERIGYFVAVPPADGSLPSCKSGLDGKLFWKEDDVRDLLKHLTEGHAIYECTVTTTRALPVAEGG